MQCKIKAFFGRNINCWPLEKLLHHNHCHSVSFFEALWWCELMETHLYTQVALLSYT